MPAPIPNPVTTFQDNWRFCVKCLSLFWNGRSDNGHCPAGAAHQGAGWDFYLPSDPANSINQPNNEPEGPWPGVTP